jgi:hypothetical protein
MALCGIFAITTPAHAAAEDGEKMLTPNQQKNIARINHDLPIDLVHQAGDSRKVAELRDHLRQTVSTYKETVKQFGSGTPESRKAGHEVVDAQKALHEQFIHEEAIPAISLSVTSN